MRSDVRRQNCPVLGGKHPAVTFGFDVCKTASFHSMLAHAFAVQSQGKHLFPRSNGSDLRQWATEESKAVGSALSDNGWREGLVVLLLLLHCRSVITNTTPTARKRINPLLPLLPR